ncbi:hypothetical protein EZE20_23425 [Arundinibacter roseus]|uniref:Resolvase/invertase-type recombinase catalytic domain-containing protein n=1 Tax=Arundinibacter roseus TaxID=2070510 RepID=A0A4R4JTL2_9BACT|nr:hypothetical protein EZE20_23425 [Arundinibacter roseus]
MMEYARTGDTIVIWKLDGTTPQLLGRSTIKLTELIEELKNRGVNLTHYLRLMRAVKGPVIL